jgi:threonine dehydratase
MSHTPFVTLTQIEHARRRIATTIQPTPIRLSAGLSEKTGVPVHLKLEQTQTTGSFKLRGAANAVLNLTDDRKAHGVVGVSTGNHGRALAYAARRNGVRCIICMSSLVPENKVEGIKAQGAEVRIIGTSQDDAQVEVDKLVREQGMTMIPPFDHPDVIAGQGTLGLDLLEQVPDTEAVLVQLSGGGLISGVAAALKAKKPDIRIIGVSMERGAAMYECQKAGKPVQVAEMATLADSLGGGIGLENRLTFNMVRDLVDDILLVSEAEISAAVRYAYWHEQQVIEGSGSVGIAALLTGKFKPQGPTLALLSGGNIDMRLHNRIINGEDVDIDTWEPEDA